MFDKLKNRWGIHSNSQLTVILIVFAITGSLSAYLSKPFLLFLGIDITIFGTTWYAKLAYWLCYIIVIFPIYQILLLIVAYLLGQYTFFYNFEKKTLSKIGLRFLFPK